MIRRSFSFTTALENFMKGSSTKPQMILIVRTNLILLCTRELERLLVTRLINAGQKDLELLGELERKIRERGVGDPEGTYKVAQAYVVLGDKTSALGVLRSSVASGFFGYPYMATEPRY
jgi:hypothetical protein